MRTRWTIMWGVALVLFGAVLLAQQLGLLGPTQLSFAMFLFGVPALLFLLTFAFDRRQWWALIPGFVLLGLTLVVFNEQNHFLTSNQSGALFLFSIGLPFLLIFFVDRRMWWALMPGGVMTVIAIMPLLADTVAGQVTGGIFFLGLAAVFALLRLATLSNPSTGWAWWPAAGLAIFGVIVLVLGGPAAQYVWPVLLIALGLWILVRGYWPRPRSE
jgi:hypothetical protein